MRLAQVLMLVPIGFGQYDSVTVVKTQGCWGPALCHQERELQQLLPLEGAIPVNYCQNQENNDEIIVHL